MLLARAIPATARSHEFLRHAEVPRHGLASGLAASDTDDGADTFVNRRQPPRARAAHAHARRVHTRHVHLGPRREIVGQALLVAQHHAPQCVPLPQVAFEDLKLMPARLVAFSARAFADTLAVEIAINRGDDASIFHGHPAQHICPEVNHACSPFFMRRF
jgi:hypothetical protein